MTRSRFVLVASKAAVLPASVALQLQVKHQNGPVTQHSCQEASNNYVLPTELDEVGHYSVEFDCVDLNHTVTVESVEFACATPVKGRLGERLAFWKDIGASKRLLDVLRDGYSLPFMSLPQKAFFNNHASIDKEQEFVCQEVSKLLASGAVTEVRREDLIFCNPLGVVKNSARKHRLIVDLRYVNQHLMSHKCKYEDIRTAADLFSKGDWFFKFDYKRGHHHIEILP